MKVQILWVAPAERRFASGDILTVEQLADFGIDADAFVASGDAQFVGEVADDERKAATVTKPRRVKG